MGGSAGLEGLLPPPPGIDPADGASPSASATRRFRRLALLRAVEAVRSTDPTRVESALKELGEGRRWLVPLVYAAGTVAVVFDGVLLLLHNWRLTLLQLFPAVWIWGMTYNIRHRVLSETTSTSVALAAAVGVLVAAQVAYWCNATFAFTLTQAATSGPPSPKPDAIGA
jgi:hypothetical protein